MKKNKPERRQSKDNSSPLMRKFVIFSISLFILILGVGSTVFIFSMRQIIRTNKGNELTQLLEIERIELETAVNAEIAIVLKMADSPLVKRYFSHPDEILLKELAFEEMASYRRAFSAFSIFWINDIDRTFHSDDNESYWVNADDPDNYWYNMSLYETEKYNFNINYNPDIKVTNLWINAPVFDNDRKPIGIVGTGIELSAFINMIFQNDISRVQRYFFNDKGEITGAKDIELIVEKKNIEEELGDLGIDIINTASTLSKGEPQSFDTPKGKIAFGAIPVLEWHSVAFIPDSIEDYKTTMTALFLVVLVIISMIFLIFNMFIFGFLKSLRRTMESLEIASKAKSNFLSTMSHEMRTPMNAIIGMAAIGKNSNDIERKQYSLDKIDDASRHLLGIINDILDMSKIEANKLELSHVAFDLNQSLRKAVSLFQFIMEEKRIQFSMSIDDNMPSFYIGDDQRLTQVITNLLSNAVKFTDKDGSINFEVSFLGEKNGNSFSSRVSGDLNRRAPLSSGDHNSFSSRVSGDLNRRAPLSSGDHICELRFEIADSGIGVPPEQQEKIFHPFEQADSGTTRKFGGTGLGLVITKRIIELMDGKIWVESEAGKGSRFIFTVKLQREVIDILTPPHSEENDEISIDDIHDKIKNKKLLIVEDIEINREILISLLEGAELIIDTAENGRQALDMVRAAPNKFDLIFMDMQMPEMDGLEATRQIRAFEKQLATADSSGARSNNRNLHKQIPIIAMTANVFQEDIEKCRAAGMDDHVGKPLELTKVLEKLRKYLT